MGYNSKYTGAEIEERLDKVADAERDANEALEIANSAKTTANKASITANSAKDAVATLQGLADADTSAIITAEVVTNVALNTNNITDLLSRVTQIESSSIDVTQEEWDELEESEAWIEGVEYNVYEE